MPQSPISNVLFPPSFLLLLVPYDGYIKGMHISDEPRLVYLFTAENASKSTYYFFKE